MSPKPTIEATEESEESRDTVTELISTQGLSREDRARENIRKTAQTAQTAQTSQGGGSDPNVTAGSITPDSSEWAGMWTDWESLQTLRQTSNGSKGLNDEDLRRIVNQVEDDAILPCDSTEKIKNAARFSVVMALRERGTQNGEELKKAARDAASEALSQIKAGR